MISVDNTENIISFCTGYGGLELGLKRVIPNLRTVAYVEIEAFAAANLVSKIEEGKLDAAPIWTDIKTFDGKPFCGKVHGLIGGYPCQPFSNAGKRAGTDDPRHLWPYIEEHIRTIRPLWCFFENVGGHLSLGFQEVAQSLRDLGYKVEAGLFTAAEVGAPHKRERLFILAMGNPKVEQHGKLKSPNSGTRPSIESGKPSAGQLANPNMQPDGQNAGGYEETEGIQGVDRQGVCRGWLAGAGEQLGLPGIHEDEICSNPQGQPNEIRNERRVLGKDRRIRKTEQHQTEDNKLADTEKQRIQRHRTEGQQESEIYAGEEIPLCNCRGNRWPARPGQEQYEWEEPRAIESGMGRTVDGFAGRVDELRLLGNGVVPETAELAFRTLINE